MAQFSFKYNVHDHVRHYLARLLAGINARRRRKCVNPGTGQGIAGTECLESRRLLSATAVVAANHAPVGTSGTVIDTVNTPYKFSASSFGFTDPNDSPPNSFAAVKITLLPTVGTLTDNGTAVSPNQFVTIADLNAGQFVFTPNANLSGGPFFLCKFQVQDNGGTGVNLDSTAKVLDVKLDQLNHAPTGKSSTVGGLVNRTYTFKTSNFGFSDAGDSPQNSFLAVKIDLLPDAGKIMDNGTAVTAGQFVSAADIAAGKLTFTPTANLKGGPFFLMKFQLQDNGGTVGGGADLDPNPKVLYVELIPPPH